MYLHIQSDMDRFKGPKNYWGANPKREGLKTVFYTHYK